MTYKGAYRAHRGDRYITVCNAGVALRWFGKLHVWTWRA